MSALLSRMRAILRDPVAIEAKFMGTADTCIEAKVCLDIAARQRAGFEKYGTTVAENGLPLRDWLQHAYEETLDKAMYLKRAIAEIDSQIPVGEKEESL